MDIKEHSKYVILVLFIATIALSLYIVKDFILPAFVGIFIAYVFFPVYKRLEKFFKNKKVGALLTSISLILLIIIPMFFLLNSIVQEASASYIIAKQQISIEKINNCNQESTIVCKTVNFFLTDSTSKQKTLLYLDQGLKSSVNYLINGVTNFALSVPKRILDLFITIFVMFYIFLDGGQLVKNLQRLLPISIKHKNKVIRKLEEVTYALIYGTILVGLLEGVILSIGFWLSNIASPMMWGLLTSFLALIPLMGPTILWVPAVIIQIYNGHIPSAIGILITGIVVSSIDTILRPKIVGNKANVHPILVLLGVLGGIKVFGLIGVIVGPLVLAFITTFAQIYEENS